MARASCAIVVALLLMGVSGAQNLGVSYKWDMPAAQVQSFAGAQFTHGSIQITFEKGHCAPIVTDAGVTGMLVVAQGRLGLKAGNAEPILEADIHGAMLRFNPADLPTLFTTQEAETYEDAGFATMAKNITYGVFRHCWHSSMDALIPPPGSASVDFFSKQHGDVLVWDDGAKYGAYNFTTRVELAKGDH